MAARFTPFALFFILLLPCGFVAANDYLNVSHREREFARAEILDSAYLEVRCARAVAAETRTVTRTRTTTVRSGVATKTATITQVSTVKSTTTLFGTTTSYKTTLPVQRFARATGSALTVEQKRDIIDGIFERYEEVASEELKALCQRQEQIRTKTVTKVKTVKQPSATRTLTRTLKGTTTTLATKTVIKTVAAATRTPDSAPKYVRCPKIVTGFTSNFTLGVFVAPTLGDPFKGSSYTTQCSYADTTQLTTNAFSWDCFYASRNGTFLSSRFEPAPGYCPEALTESTKVGDSCEYIDSCPYLPGRKLVTARMAGANPSVFGKSDLTFSLACIYNFGRCQYNTAGTPTLFGDNAPDCPPTLPADRIKGYCMDNNPQ